MKQLIFAIIIAISTPFYGKTKVIENAPLIVGYLPTWKMPYNIDNMKSITHLCLAFGMVKNDGSVDVESIMEHRKIIRKAQQKNIKVLLSIGGGGTESFSAAILNPQAQKKLIVQLKQIVESLNLEGIDIDFEEWEGGMKGASNLDKKKSKALEIFYRNLRKELGEEVILSAAVTGSWDNNDWGTYNCFGSKMHRYLDFVSLMIYDFTGPWSGTHTGPHSDWTFFENSINHWLHNKKLPAHKLIAGVPFYGYHFLKKNDAKGAKAISYKQIIEDYPNDKVHQTDSIGLIYYDGMKMIERKSKYIKEKKLGGIMIWELTQDTQNKDKSLMGIIHKELME